MLKLVWKEQIENQGCKDCWESKWELSLSLLYASTYAHLHIKTTSLRQLFGRYLKPVQLKVQKRFEETWEARVLDKADSGLRDAWRCTLSSLYFDSVVGEVWCILTVRCVRSCVQFFGDEWWANAVINARITAGAASQAASMSLKNLITYMNRIRILISNFRRKICKWLSHEWIDKI